MINTNKYKVGDKLKFDKNLIKDDKSWNIDWINNHHGKILTIHSISENFLNLVSPINNKPYSFTNDIIHECFIPISTKIKRYII